MLERRRTVLTEKGSKRDVRAYYRDHTTTVGIREERRGHKRRAAVIRDNRRAAVIRYKRSGYKRRDETSRGAVMRSVRNSF